MQKKLRVKSLLCVERHDFRWFRHMVTMPPGRPPGEVFWACPPGGRPRGRSRLYSLDCAGNATISHPEELEEVAWRSGLPGCYPCTLTLNRWKDEWIKIYFINLNLMNGSK